MIRIIIGVILAGSILYAADFVVLAPLSGQFLIAVGIAAMLFACAWVSPNRKQWVFLRHMNGNEFKWWEYAVSFFGAAVVVLMLLYVAHAFPIPTLLVMVVLACSFMEWWPWLKDKYTAACEKRLKKMQEYKNTPHLSVADRLAQRQTPTPPSKEDADAVMNEVYEDYDGL